MQGDEVMCLAMYLKSAAVGMNNNQLPVNSEQFILAEKYHAMKKN
jgi:hypothetical protein